MSARGHVDPAGTSAIARLRSALLGLSTRIAEARGEDEVCRSVVEGLRNDAFGFDAVGLYLAGSSSFDPRLKASAGPFGKDGGAPVSELKLPLKVGQSAIGELVVQRDRTRAFEKGDMEIAAAAASQVSSNVSAQVAAPQALASVSFTAEQANAGQAAYKQHCASCHGANLDDGEFGPPLKGVEFRSRWGGTQPLEPLYTHMEQRMPPAADQSVTSGAMIGRNPCG